MSTHQIDADLLERAAAWATQDPDPVTAAALRELCAAAPGDAGAAADLADRFAAFLAFGTAGLRAELGPGPNRMNSMVVRRTAAGIGRFLLDAAAGAYTPLAVIGFDARHNSDVFARESAAVLTAAGIEVQLLPSALPTPVLAYAVRALGAEAGIMVTASHNPPADNGYKVYLGGRAESGWGQGAQIVSPVDARIAARIDNDEPITSIALAEGGWGVLPGAGEPGDIEGRYLQAIAGVVPATDGNGGDAITAARENLRIVLTPMHGVGGHTMAQALGRAGFSRVRLVAEQAAPDPDFPTVAFPNPEEPGALDLALALATDTGADLVIANDPDADRCAAAVKFPDTGWRMLRGDEVGWLLGDRCAATAADTAVLANSIVSSRMLASIAAAHSLAHEYTLTGFKWISRVPDLAFGYEEALGYCVAPSLVRDKDGMSAALMLADYAAELKAAGSSLPEVLDALALAHGLHQTDQLSVRVADLGLLDTMMHSLRSAPPASLGSEAVTGFEDLSLGANLPPTDGLLFATEAGTRVIVRPSGTEPKLKCYLEVIASVASPADLPAARAAGNARLEAIKLELAGLLNP
ncbi:phospho-sugar mutase [Paeniglutamicibacter sulfureus]|uniref:Phosphomannomutase n=1 Tax=Paeniglutamicibacter sulfureus TaxID=43666 RepID=A0ABU2BFV0_9MICC|nr:phospho-sugar mutase [Paeniglutamicibacter sulfureus]MDR7357483.1 phosphomannomutase [Paeniglutamicibacter sulfureus]